MDQTEVIPIWLPEYDWLDDEQFLTPVRGHPQQIRKIKDLKSTSRSFVISSSSSSCSTSCSNSCEPISSVNSPVRVINNEAIESNLLTNQDSLVISSKLDAEDEDELSHQFLNNCTFNRTIVKPHLTSNGNGPLRPTFRNGDQMLPLVNHNLSGVVSVERTKTFTRRKNPNGNTIVRPSVLRRGTFRCRPNDQPSMVPCQNQAHGDEDNANCNFTPDRDSANESIMNRTFTKDMFSFDSPPCSTSTPNHSNINRKSFIIKPSNSILTRIPKPGPKKM